MGQGEDPGEVTRLLERMSAGDGAAERELLPLVYEELRRVAIALFQQERAGHTLQPTAVVHEAWMRLSDGRAPDLTDRRHFLAVAARAMRQVLIDHARGRDREKRGGDWRRVTLSDAGSGPDSGVDLVALHEALEELAALHERQALIVELRYFGGLSVAEVAELLGIAVRTAEKDWTMAKIWLRRALKPGED